MCFLGCCGAQLPQTKLKTQRASSKLLNGKKFDTSAQTNPKAIKELKNSTHEEVDKRTNQLRIAERAELAQLLESRT